MRQVGIDIGTVVNYRIARVKNDEEETCDEKETGDKEETTCDEEETHGHRSYEVRRIRGFCLDAQNAYKLAAIVPVCTTAATTAALSDDPRHRVLCAQIHLIPLFHQFFYDSQLPTTLVVRLTTIMKIRLLTTTS